MAGNRVTVHGLAELRANLAFYDVDAAKALKEELRAAGDLVRADAQDRLEGVSPKSAAGLRVYVRSGSRVSVEQSLRKTTGRRPDFGTLQMRQGLLPALDDKRAEVAVMVDRSLSSLADRI